MTPVGLRLTVRADRSISTTRLGEGGDLQDGRLDLPPLRERTIDILTALLAKQRLDDRRYLELLGEHLYEALFVDPIAQSFRTVRAEKDKGDRLTVYLEFGEGAANLAAWPWEYLWVPPTSGSSGSFMSTEVDLVLSRYQAIQDPDPITLEAGPLRVLLVTAEPSDRAMKQLDAEAIKNQIESEANVHSNEPTVSVESSTEPRAERLIEQLDTSKPHVLHLVGQGRTKDERGEIALPGADGRTDWVDAATFGETFRQAEWRPMVVVLHLWEPSVRPTDTELSFVQFAPELVKRGIPAVIAMRFPFVGQASAEFNKHFYARLAACEPVDAAVREARTMMSIHRHWVFGTPVLYLHSIGGVIVPPEKPVPDTDGKRSSVRAEEPAPTVNGAGAPAPAPPLEAEQTRSAAPDQAADPTRFENRAVQIVRAGRDKLAELELPAPERRELLTYLLDLKRELAGRSADQQGEYVKAEYDGTRNAPEDDPRVAVLEAVVDAEMVA